MSKCDPNYYNTKIMIHIIAIVIILLFSIIGGIYILTHNDSTTFGRIIVIAVVLSALYLAHDRDTYLPFLGKTVLPLNIIAGEKIPNGANIDYLLNLKGYPNGTRVFYWGAKSTNSKDPISDPIKAYDDYSNSGVAIVNNEKANLKFYCPDKYSVGNVFKQVLNRHLHYRTECPNSGLLSSVKTIYVDCK